MQLVACLIWEVARDIEAEICVHEVANKRLQRGHTLAIRVENHLFRALCSYVITGCDPLINSRHNELRWNLHRKKHLNKLLTCFILIQASLSDIAAYFPDFQEAEHNLLWVLFGNRLKEWDYAVLNLVEVLLHICLKCQSAFGVIRCGGVLLAADLGSLPDIGCRHPRVLFFDGYGLLFLLLKFVC